MGTSSLTVSRRRKKWARKFVQNFQTVDSSELVRAVTAQIARKAGVSLPASFVSEMESEIDFSSVDEPPEGWDDLWIIGLIHELSVSSVSREKRGAWYTPEPVVKGLLSLALDMYGKNKPPIVLDPTCGGGAFLLAALEGLVGRGFSPAEALHTVKGMDIDAGALLATSCAVQLWALMHGEIFDEYSVLRLGNALVDMPEGWADERVVVGNPPFGSPLKSDAVDPISLEYQQSNADYLGAYADLAAMHFLRAVQTSEKGSVVAMVQPQSVLSSRDLGNLRSFFGESAPLHALWVTKELVFDASVRACAPVVKVGVPAPMVELADKPTVEHRGSVSQDTWSALAVSALGAPAVSSKILSQKRRLGELVSATAGFRDEYYGLRDICSEWGENNSVPPNKLVTVGAIDPLWHDWGVAPLRFGGAVWERPWADTSRATERTVRWVSRQKKPKILLATQASTLEPVIDYEGSLVSVTPLIIVDAEVDDLALAAAVFLSPPVVLWCWRRWFGSAMAVNSIKLSAKQVLELPLPADESCWAEAASYIQKSQISSREDARQVVLHVAECMNEAYASDEKILSWWRERAKL